MKFRFSLETVMQHRKLQKDLAMKDYVEAQAQLENCLTHIRALYSQADEGRQRISKLLEQGGRTSSQIGQIEDFITGQKVKIIRERQKARELMKVVEDKHEILIEQAREHKKFEMLKEKRKAEFTKAQQRREVKQVDDLVTMKFRKG